MCSGTIALRVPNTLVRTLREKRSLEQVLYPGVNFVKPVVAAAACLASWHLPAVR